MPVGLGADGAPHADVADPVPDPVATLVLGAAPPLELLLVGGRPVVERDGVLTVDAEAPAPGVIYRA